MKTKFVQKILFACCLAQTGALHADSLLRQTVTCHGETVNSVGDKQNIAVTGNPKDQTLDIAFYQGETPAFFDTLTYALTRVRPLYPVFSLTAVSDLRLTGGGRNEATLVIQVETFPQTSGYPAKLTIEMTSLRGSHQVKQYDLTCEISR